MQLPLHCICENVCCVTRAVMFAEQEQEIGTVQDVDWLTSSHKTNARGCAMNAVLFLPICYQKIVNSV